MQTEKEFDGFTHMNEYMPLLLPPLKHLLMTRGMWPFTHDKTSLSLIHPPITNMYLSSSFLLPTILPQSPSTSGSLPNQNSTSKPHLFSELPQCASYPRQATPTASTRRRTSTANTAIQGLQKRRSQTHHCRTLQRLLGCLYRREEEIRSWRWRWREEK
jgi:hypothetical protein